MVLILLFSFGGVVAGLLLLRAAPVIRGNSGCEHMREPLTSMIIPARNEATNLPLLLASLQNSASDQREILVVDDASTDGTAAIAEAYGARVICSVGLPQGWTGKTWACMQGARAARGDVLFFLDADTRFVDGGYGRMLGCFSYLPKDTALSVLPFHRTECWYEELSLFFNIVVAMGAGSFGGLYGSHLFGQSLLIGTELYWRSGGHERVRGEILENLNLAAHIREAGGVPHAFGGRGVLETRMFPGGFQQLRESWLKGFAAGAGVVSPRVLALSIYWLGAAMLAAIMLLTLRNHYWMWFVMLYITYVVQIGWYGQQLGTFRWLSATVYPVSLIFYFGMFAESMWRRNSGARVTWRGRQV